MLKINNKIISYSKKPFFIADIAANHNGSLNKARDLIHQCAEAGADAAKFQHFTASTIVSDYGFKKLNKIKSHQSDWKKSVYDVYKYAEVNFEWINELKKTCKDAGIFFFSTPYSLEYIDKLDKYMSAYKIGSGDITWIEAIIKIAKKNKPILLATGASDLKDIARAIKNIKKYHNKIVLMQCNTNYTGDLKNFNYINLNVLKTFRKKYSSLTLGLSDHTPGHSTVLGAITLGARVIEKHFTDNVNNNGPDHKFSMTPSTWRTMIDRSNELFISLGSENKTIEKNEKESVIVQRRSIRASKDLKKGDKINKEDLVFLRPCPIDALNPYDYPKILNKKLNKNIVKGDTITLNDL